MYISNNNNILEVKWRTGYNILVHRAIQYGSSHAPGSISESPPPESRRNGLPFHRSCVLSLAGRTLSDCVSLLKFLLNSVWEILIHTYTVDPLISTLHVGPPIGTASLQGTLFSPQNNGVHSSRPSRLSGDNLSIRDKIDIILMDYLSCSGLNVMSRRCELVVFHSTSSRGHVLRFHTNISIRSGSLAKSGGRQKEEVRREERSRNV